MGFSILILLSAVIALYVIASLDTGVSEKWIADQLEPGHKIVSCDSVFGDELRVERVCVVRDTHGREFRVLAQHVRGSQPELVYGAAR
jgi:hypothetical protein